MSKQKFLFALRNGWINWRDFSGEIGNVINDDFVESINEKLELMFNSFVPQNLTASRRYFDAYFRKKEEALNYTDEFMKHTEVFNAFIVEPTLDSDMEEEMYIARIYLENNNKENTYKENNNNIN